MGARLPVGWRCDPPTTTETDMDTKEQERLLLLLAGIVDAQKHAIEAIIASHPRIDLLHGIWHRSKPQWIDASEQRNAFRSEDFQQGFVRELAAFSLVIDETEQLTRPLPGDGPSPPDGSGSPASGQ